MTPKDGNLASMLHACVSLAPAAPLYSFLDRRLSVRNHFSRYALWQAATSLAGRLQETGAQRKPVVLCYPHGADFVIAFWGCLLAGAWPVPLPLPRSIADDHLPRVLRHCRAARVLTVSQQSQRLRDMLCQTLPLVEVLATDEPDCGAGRRWQMPPVSGDNIAFIQYTSGSTGRPRGVVIRHRNICCNTAQIAAAFACSSDDCGLSWLPFHHDMGLIGHVVQPVSSRLHNYFMAPGDFAARPLLWLQAISRYRASISGGPSFAYQWCIERVDEAQASQLELSQWRLAYCGAEAIQAPTLRRFAAHVRGSGFRPHSFFPCYGMAEATLFVSGRHGLHLSGSGSQRGAAVSSGFMAEDVVVRIAHVETGVWVDDGVEGEICLRSPAMGSHYYRDLRATARASVRRDGQRWLRSGDLGFLENGQLHVTGRCCNSFKYLGRRLHAEDIEQVVATMLGSRLLRRCALLVNTRVRGPAPQLVLLLALRRGQQQALSTQCQFALRKAVRERFGIELQQCLYGEVGSLPLTSSGKLRRQQCCQVYENDVARPLWQRRFKVWWCCAAAVGGGKQKDHKLLSQ